MHDASRLHLLIGELKLPSPVSHIQLPLLKDKQVELFIKRDELIHPVIQGNKWRKLKYNLLQALKEQQSTLLSFGGAYSNHLHALAAAGNLLGIKTIGIIRGEATHPLNPCLQDMQNWGMQLEFIKRIDYREKTSDKFINHLKDKFGRFYLIPEGGNNPQGFKGCAELLDELQDNYNIICCEVGSGTMLSSLITYNKNAAIEFLGFSIMKNKSLEKDIEKNLHNSPLNHLITTPWKINHDYHFNGYARTSKELNQFINDFKLEHNIQLEPVYSGKMLYGILELAAKNYFKPGTKILAIHGGGLQGLRGFPELAS